MPENQKKLDSLFAAAVEIESTAERKAFLDSACGENLELRQQLDHLLQSDEKAGSFLEKPPVELDATLFDATRDNLAGSLEAGLAPAFGESTAVIIGDANHSVLKALGNRLDEVPKVSLRESEGDDPITRPRSPEMPDRKSDSRYRLDGEIARGGMGAILKGRDTDLGRDLAIKVLLDSHKDKPEVIQRFVEEAQIGGQLQHPGIAPVYELGQFADERPFFSMKLVKGETLSKLLADREDAGDDRGKFIGIFEQVCQTMAYAHSRGVIHRDLKPANIMVGAFGEVQVMDWGLAKVLSSGGVADEKKAHDKQQGQSIVQTLRSAGSDALGTFGKIGSHTQMGSVMGTPAYMPPEQALGEIDHMDERADVFGLGAILCEVLTGKPPYVGDDGTQVFRLASQGKLEDCFERLGASGADAELITLAKQCLELEPEDRPRDANVLSERISGYLESVEARLRETELAKVDAQVRSEELRRRQRLAFTAGGAIVASLLIGIAASGWQLVRATRAEDLATDEAARATAAEKKATDTLAQVTSERDAKEQARKEAETERQRAEREEIRANAHARRSSASEKHSRRLLYASDMNLAQQSLQQNNLGKARRLLDRHRPQPGVEDLRGWEWRYLWQLTRSNALLTLTNRTERAWSVSLSHDGRHLAVGWGDGRVDLWDVAERQLVRTLADQGQRPEGRVAFSPVRNLLAAASERNVVKLYDLDSGAESVLWRANQPGKWEVRDLAFSRDGSKLVLYAGSYPQNGDAAWVVDVSSASVDSRHQSSYSANFHLGSARLSPDNRRLYLARSDRMNDLYSIQCIELETGEELWQTERERDFGLTALDISPDGRVLASASGFVDTSIRIWDAETGKVLVRLDGHTGWVCRLVFTDDGRRLISAATDQSIRFWDTADWTETRVLRGHTDEVQSVAISETAQLIASAGKNGEILFWKEDGKHTPDGYRQLPEGLGEDSVKPLDHSRLLLLPESQPPELLDLEQGLPAVSVPGVQSATEFLGWFETNTLFRWNRSSQILASEWRGTDFMPVGAITLESGTRPTRLAYNGARQLLAWDEGTLSTSVVLASLATPTRRIELTSDFTGLVPSSFSEDGEFLAALSRQKDKLLVWNVETGEIVVSVSERVHGAVFAADGTVLAATIPIGNNHEVRFYDLSDPDKPPQRVSGKEPAFSISVSPDGELVVVSTRAGQVRLFDPTQGKLIESIHGAVHGAFATAFSPDGQRLISTSSGRESVMLWDVGTRQELLTLSGTASLAYNAMWSEDGNAIVIGAPWQSWRAPSWEEINAVEAKEKAGIK